MTVNVKANTRLNLVLDNSKMEMERDMRHERE